MEDYREGGNFSFLVEHPERRILIVPSRGCWTGQFEGVVADVVFLRIGGAGTKDRLMQDHWREAVVRTGATTVYPIHWDNFFRPLHKPLASLVPGSFKKRLTFLKGLAEESGGRIRVIAPKTWDEIAMKATPPVPPDVPRQPPPPLPSPPRRCGDSA